MEDTYQDDINQQAQAVSAEALLLQFNECGLENDLLGEIEKGDLLDVLKRMGIGGEHDEYLAHLSINSAAQVEYAIRRPTSWFAQLKVAEGFIHDKSEALRNFVFELRKGAREDLRTQQKLSEAIQQGDILTAGDYRDQLKMRELSKNQQFALLRDALMELSVAIAHKQQILAEHPEALTKSYMELQLEAAPEALTQKLIVHATEHMMQRHGIPLELANTLLSLDPATADQLLLAAADEAAAVSRSLKEAR